VYKAIAGDNWPISATYNLSASATAVDEGDTFTVTLNTTNVEDGTNVPYTITGVDSGDLSSGSITGNFTITGGTDTLSFTLSNDETPEGVETLTLSLDNGADSVSVTINDTSDSPTTFGEDYANSYLATTGGSLLTASGSIDSTIDSASDGDAILIPSGTHTITPLSSQNGRDPFRLKNVLIVGDTNDPTTVTIDYNPDANGNERDHPLFSNRGYTSAASTYKQMAFCTMFRNADTYLGTNYSNALCRLFDPTEGIMINVYIDLDTQDVSWHYDNGNSSDNDVRFIRCTFANYGTWQSDYSGRDDQITVSNCAFEGTTLTGSYVDGGGNVTNTTSASTAGYNYVPNTTAVF